MKHYNYRDLEQFGVNALTGEACNFGMRQLCDLSERGVTLVCEYLGIPEIKAINWNSRVGNEDAVACIMLTPYSLIELLAFAALLVDGMKYALVPDDGGVVVGFGGLDELTEYTQHLPNARYRVYAPLVDAPHHKSRNIHAMSGRIA